MKKPLLPVVGIFIFFSSCTHYYYAPNGHNVPVFKEKNEARLSGAYINGSELSGCDVEVGYAVTKEVAVIANALIINPNAKLQNNSPDNSPNIIGSGNGQLYELGVGYYKPIPSGVSAISKKFVFETYGVLGLGNSTNIYGNYPDYHVTTNLFKAYVQPSVSFTTNLFDIIFSAKIGELYNFGTKSNYPDAIYDTLVQHSSTIANDITVLNQNRASFLFEPAVTFRIGFKYVKCYVQYGASFINSGMKNLTSSPVWDFGLTVCIAERFWQKDERPHKERWKQIWD